MESYVSGESDESRSLGLVESSARERLDTVPGISGGSLTWFIVGGYHLFRDCIEVHRLVCSDDTTQGLGHVGSEGEPTFDQF